MHEDLGERFAIGDRRSWDVELVDGEACGWPWPVLVDATVAIEPGPGESEHASLAELGELRAGWRGGEEWGSRLRIRGGLVADVWNPLFPAPVTGVVRRIRIVSYAFAIDPRGVWRADGPWQLEDVERTPRWLGAGRRAVDHPAATRPDGLLINLDIVAPRR